MGLFLSPFSGHAVGGGGGTGGPGATSPPPGMGDEAGMRTEIDTVNRDPLKLLRTTMNKHKPKYMKIVPPGQQIGALAPPYAWDGRERDDWEYKISKPKAVREGEFDMPSAPKPHKLQSPAPPHPAGGPPAPTGPAQQVDPRHARIDAIQAEIKQIRGEVHQLIARQKAAVESGKKESGRIGKQFAPQVSSESLQRSRLNLIEVADYTPFGIERDPHDPPRPTHDAHAGPLPMRSPEQALERPKLKSLSSRGIPTGLRSQPPKASFELIAIHRELDSRHARITQLTQELKNLRQQMQLSHESSGLRSNNLHRISLLLK